MTAGAAADREALGRLLVGIENQARQAALDVHAAQPAAVVIVASAGATGAVGLAAARHLANYGYAVKVLFAGVRDTARAPAAVHLDILESIRTPVRLLTRPEEVAAAVEDVPEDALILATCSADDGDARAEAVESELAAIAHPGVRFVRYEDGLEAPTPSAAVEPPAPPHVPLTRDEVRMLDNLAIERHHIPGIVLMENAGWRLALAVREALEAGVLREPLLVCCGRGNNGGDGMVAARHLAAWGVSIEVLLAGGMQPATDDAALNMQLLRDCGRKVLRSGEADALDMLDAALARAGSLLDALLGTGLSGEVRGLMQTVLARLSACGLPVLAADIPSGLDADTGRPLGPAPRCVCTVTFAAPKIGLQAAGKYTGEVVVADIGAPWYIGPYLASRRQVGGVVC